MKFSSIEPNDNVGVDIVDGGAKKADIPIYNALKPSMRMIRVRHAARIYYEHYLRTNYHPRMHERSLPKI